MDRATSTPQTLRLWERDFRLSEWGLAVDDVVPFLAGLADERAQLRLQLTELLAEVETLRLIAFSADMDDPVREVPPIETAASADAEPDAPAPAPAASVASPEATYHGDVRLRLTPPPSIPGMLAFQNRLADVPAFAGLLGMRRGDGYVDLDIRLMGETDLAAALDQLDGVVVVAGDTRGLELRLD